LCAICGKKLTRGRWFVGGPLSAFHAEGCYIDTPLHGDCARYALQVCPYLAAPKYSGRLDDAKIDAAELPDTLVMIDPTVLPERPDVFVAVMATGQTIKRNNGQIYVRPRRPYKNVEYWRFGQQLPFEEGEVIKARALGNFVQDAPKLLQRRVVRGGRVDRGDRL
jgi:hypothetical protein